MTAIKSARFSMKLPQRWRRKAPGQHRVLQETSVRVRRGNAFLIEDRPIAGGAGGGLAPRRAGTDQRRDGKGNG